MGKINTNIAALGAQFSLQKNQNDLNLHLQRLSSGLRINRGKDDPAGLIGSETLRSEIEGIKQGVANSTRADNVINTAEGALGEVSSLLLQLQSLTSGAANTGALSKQEIEANQLQVDSILNSINRISNTTQFNGVRLLNGSLDYITSGISTSAIDVAQINTAKLPDNGTQTVTVEVTGSAQLAQVAFNQTTTSGPVTIEVAGNDGTEQLSFASGVAGSAIAFAVNQIADSTGVSATTTSAGVTFNSTEYGADRYVSIKTLSGSFVDGKDFGQNATVAINGSSANVDGRIASVRSGDLDVTLTLDKDLATLKNGANTTSFTITGGGARFQIGSRVNRQGQIQIGIGSVSTTKLGNGVIGYLSSLGTGGDNNLISGSTTGAQKILTESIAQVATLRGRLGALQKNVLQTNISSLQVALENVTSSESAIRDADFAEETAALTRAQILTQAGTSVLSQANSAPQNVLSLLR